MTQSILTHDQVEQSHIKHLLDLAMEQGHADVYSGKREISRYSAAIRLEVRVDTPEGRRILPALLHNISCAGLALWTREPVEVTPLLHVREFQSDNRGEWFSAKATRCAPGIKGFLVGVKFHHPLPDEAPVEEEAVDEIDVEETNEPATEKGGWLTRLGSIF